MIRVPRPIRCIVERRRVPRLDLNAPVEVRVLAGNKPSRGGRVADISGRGLKLLVESPLGAGTLIRVDAGQLMLLGEVCYCRPDQGQWAVGVELEHALADLDQLLLLNQRLFAAEAARPEAVTTSEDS